MEISFTHKGIEVPNTPERREVRCWRDAPWNHIKGAIVRETKSFNPAEHGGVDEAELALDSILLAIIDKHVPLVRCTKPKPAPWWTKACDKSLANKCNMFQKYKMSGGSLKSKSAKAFRSASKVCREIQKRAFARHQKQLKAKLQSMKKSDRNFWQLTKEIAGLDGQRGGATPDVDDIVDHFAEKMSNGKDEEDDQFRTCRLFYCTYIWIQDSIQNSSQVVESS